MILLQFSINHFNLFKIFIKGLIIFNWAFFATNCWAKSGDPKGLLEEFENIVSNSRMAFQINYQKNMFVEDNLSFLNDKNAQQHFFVDPNFFTSILFFTNEKYINLIKKDKCLFYSLLMNGLLRDYRGPVNRVLIQYKDKKNKWKSTYISINNYLSLIYKNECLKTKSINESFSIPYLKDTINSIAFTTPQNKKDCKEIYNSWVNDPMIPNLCKIAETMKNAPKFKNELKTLEENTKQSIYLMEQISLANKYNKYLTYYQKVYVLNLCSNINDEKLYCERYLKRNYWVSVVEGSGNPFSMYFRCQKYRNNKKDKKQKNSKLNRFRKCQEVLSKDKQICHFNNSHRYPTLTPKPNCDNIGTSLKISRLKPDYQDCPGMIQNASVVTANRVLSYFVKPKNKKTINKSKYNCWAGPTANIAKLIIENGAKNSWQQKLCYNDLLEGKEICLPSIFGVSENSPYSEDKNIEKILKKVRGAPEGLKCKLVTDKEYNPARLAYKQGCFIVYNSKTCSAMNCPKKIIYGGRQINIIKYIKGTNIDYFMNSLRYEGTDFASLLRSEFQISNRRILNLTMLRSFLREKKNGIIHGMGCIEDLLASFYVQKRFNQCRPLTFVVDGIKRYKNKAFLVIRTGLDEVHSPRLIEWNRLFSSVRKYQMIHPMKAWNLYGLYKN